MTTIWSEQSSADDGAVVRWRFDELVRAGYGWSAALNLAKRPDVDLHLAEKLVRTGCPQATALRILL